jgi:hypothetical protein
LWPMTAFAATHHFDRYWSNSGHWLTVAHQPQFIALEKLLPSCRSIAHPENRVPSEFMASLFDRSSSLNYNAAA